MKILINNNHGNMNCMLINWVKSQFIFDEVHNISDYNQCIQHIRSNKYDILLTDSIPLDITIAKLQAYISNFSPSIKIISYINQKDIIVAPHLYKLGIDGLMTFQTSYELLESIQYITSEEKYISPSILQNMYLFNKYYLLREHLTNQEYEIFIRNKWGYSDKDITNALWCSLKHVRNTKSIAFKKIKYLKKNNPINGPVYSQHFNLENHV
jgi:DNA-binding NarL/FixJ family response regulator